MKKTYIIPVVKIYEMRTSRMIALSGGYDPNRGTTDNVTSGANDANYNSFDDQETPWYRR